MSDQAGQVERLRGGDGLDVTASDPYRVVIEGARTALFVHVDGVIRFANPASAELFGVADRHELIGTHIVDTVPLEWRDVFAQRLAEIRAGDPLVDQRRPMLRRDGREIIVDVHATRMDWFGEAAVQVEVRDVTERANADEALRIERAEHIEQLTAINSELERAVAIKDRVLSMATHDMRNPIASILGFSAVLRSDGRDPALVEESLGAIERQTRRLDHLVDDLLSLTLVEGGNVVLAPAVVAVGALVREVIADGQLQASCTVDIAEGVEVWADPVRVAQIVANLVSNAVKYGAEPVVVTALPDGDWVELRVEDAGSGVAPEHIDDLFEMFSSASRTAASARRGTGLGLAIVRALAEAQGGDVAYRPNPPHGACFVVRLPARAGVVRPEDPASAE